MRQSFYSVPSFARYFRVSGRTSPSRSTIPGRETRIRAARDKRTPCTSFRTSYLYKLARSRDDKTKSAGQHEVNATLLRVTTTAPIVAVCSRLAANARPYKSLISRHTTSSQARDKRSLLRNHKRQRSSDRRRHKENKLSRD